MLNFTLTWRNGLWKLALLSVLVITAFGYSQFSAGADHDKFRYKFPCLPADACYITWLASAQHVPGNAFDFDPQGGAGLGLVPAVSEGIFRGYQQQHNVCTWNQDPELSISSLGMFAVIEDMHGRTLRYAHLSSFGELEIDQRVYQGDIVGREGNTGYTFGCTPHLHLEGISTTSYIDGLATSSLTDGPTLYESTNSLVGDTNPSSQPEYAIREVYRDLGNMFGVDNRSWNLFGWTADLTADPPPPATPTVEHVGCTTDPLCQLYVHAEPYPCCGPWGWAQNFRKHPETVTIEGTPAPYTDNSIMVGVWDPDAAYWVSVPFYEAWLLGEPNPDPELPAAKIGLPLMHAIPASSQQTCGSEGYCCPTSEGCTKYQRFSHGYIWESNDGSGIQAAVFCPDVAAMPGQWPDYVVDLLNDILGVIQHYQPAAGGEPPYDPQFDVNGDGVIDLFVDVLGSLQHYLQECVPGGNHTHQ